MNSLMNMPKPCPKCGGNVKVYPAGFGRYEGKCEACGKEFHLVISSSGLQYSVKDRV